MEPLGAELKVSKWLVVFRRMQCGRCHAGHEFVKASEPLSETKTAEETWTAYFGSIRHGDHRFP